MLTRLWFFLSGAASAWAVTSVARHDWMALGVFLVVAVGALVVPMRGWLGTAEESLCRHNNRVADGTDSYRRARLSLVRRDD